MEKETLFACLSPSGLHLHDPKAYWFKNLQTGSRLSSRSARSAVFEDLLAADGCGCCLNLIRPLVLVLWWFQDSLLYM